jgi:hypothetical protein
MQGDALDILGERVLVRRNPGARIAHHAWDGHGLGQALLLDKQFERPIAAATGRDLEHAGPWPSASRIGRTLRPCRSVRRAMSSATSSIETPAFTRRTLP